MNVAVEIDRLLTDGVDIHPNSPIHEKLNQALRQPAVSGQLPICEHDYKQEDQYWFKCTKCGEISPIGNFR